MIIKKKSLKTLKKRFLFKKKIKNKMSSRHHLLINKNINIKNFFVKKENYKKIKKYD